MDDKQCNDDEEQFSYDEEQFSGNDEHMNQMDECDSFVTSTPQKEKYQCQECENQTQCTDCFVRQTLEESGQLNSNKKRKVHFKDYSLENYWSSYSGPFQGTAGPNMVEFSPLYLCATL